MRFCSITAHCLSARLCHELYAGGRISIRAAYDAKIQEKPYQQYSLISNRNYMQCEWYLNVELCIKWSIPSIFAQDAHVSGVL